jgi:beta-glucanase (GH16 family)
MSGGIGSRRARKYGRWEVRFRVDRGAGYSAVALLWPQHDTDWPAAGEIDFTEVNKGARTIDHIIVHNGPSNAQQGSLMHADFSQWQTVGVEWEPDHVAFYLDGVRQSFVVTSTAMVPSLTPMHLALQLDQGCDGWVECRNVQTPPQVEMDVDWVKMYAP